MPSEVGLPLEVDQTRAIQPTVEIQSTSSEIDLSISSFAQQTLATPPQTEDLPVLTSDSSTISLHSEENPNISERRSSIVTLNPAENQADLALESDQIAKSSLLALSTTSPNNLILPANTPKKLQAVPTDYRSSYNSLKYEELNSELGNKIDLILDRFKDTKMNKLEKLTIEEKKLINQHPKKAEFLAKLYTTNQGAFIDYMQTSVSFSLDNDISKDMEGHLSPEENKSLQQIMSILHPNHKDISGLLKHIDKFKSDPKNVKTFSESELNTLVKLHELRPEAFNELIKNISKDEKLKILKHIELYSSSRHSAIINQLIILTTHLENQEPQDKLAIIQHKKALDDLISHNDKFEKIKTNLHKGSVSNISSGDLGVTKETMLLISRFLTAALISNEGDIAALDKTLETIQVTIREIERQEEVLFKKELEAAPLKTRCLFHEIQNMMGTSPIPIDQKFALLSYLKIDVLAKGFRPILEQAKQKKAINLNNLQNNLPTESVDDIKQMLFTLNGPYIMKYVDIFKPLSTFFSGFFEAKLGSVNTQPTTDSLELALHNYEKGLPEYSPDMSKEVKREISSVKSTKVLTSHYQGEEVECAQEGFIERPVYNLWNKNSWECSRNQNGELQEVKWISKFRIKQLDGSFKKVDCKPVNINLSSLRLTKNNETIAWDIVTKICRGQSPPREAKKISDIPNQYKGLMDVPQDFWTSTQRDPQEDLEVVVKYNKLTQEIANLAAPFKQTIESTYSSAIIDNPPPPPASKISSFFNKFTFSLPSLTMRRNSFTTISGESQSKNSTIKTKNSATTSFFNMNRREKIH